MRLSKSLTWENGDYIYRYELPEDTELFVTESSIPERPIRIELYNASNVISFAIDPNQWQMFVENLAIDMGVMQYPIEGY